MNSDAAATAAQQATNTIWPVISPYIQMGVTFLIGWVLQQPWKMIGKKPNV